MEKTLTLARLRQLLDYQAATGTFTWKVAASRNVVVGMPAGGRDSNGYVRIKLDGVRYKAHRLVWLWVHGEVPPMIDHINGVKHDNRIENLRPVTNRENMQNMHAPSRGGLGARGVRRRGHRFEARITVDGDLVSLGCFGTVGAAVAARKAAEAQYFRKAA